MTTTPQTTETTHPERPGLTDGVTGEFTVYAKIKPGQAASLRATLADNVANIEPVREAMREIGTLHFARHVLFDDDTRYMFASTFDGSWDTYVDDFAKTIAGKNLDRVFGHMEGFPGIADPGVKDWFVKYQAPAAAFISAYPDLTVQQILKDQRVNEAFQAVLDTPEFRAALENPALKPLLATPAFQKLLDEAAG